MSAVRVVGVGGSLIADVALDSDVLVLPTFTLVHTAEGRVYRLIERGGDVVELPMTNDERGHALELFNR